MERFDRLQVDDTAAVSVEMQFDAISSKEQENSRIKLETHIQNVSNHRTGHKHKNQVLTSEQEQDETGAQQGQGNWEFSSAI